MSNRRPLAGIYQITTFLAVVLLLLILFVSAAYFFVIPSPDPSREQHDALGVLAKSRTAWESGRPASFRYVVDRDCQCVPEYVEPYIATEQAGTRTAIFNIEVESADGEFLSIPPEPIWIGDLFDLIERSLVDDKLVEVEYDRDLGFPVSIVVHPEPSPTDSVYRVEVRDFETLEYR
jgi:hypothetical protein